MNLIQLSLVSLATLVGLTVLLVMWIMGKLGAMWMRSLFVGFIWMLRMRTA